MDQEIKKAISNITGWEDDKILCELAFAKSLGISEKKYFRKACWEMDHEALTAFAEKEQVRLALREDQIQEIIKETGWSKEKTKASLRAAKEAGISRFQYIRKAAYELAPEMLPELGQALSTARRRREDDYAFLISTVCKKTGWSQDKAIQQMNEAKQLGISYLKYVQNYAWELNEEELDELALSISEYKEETILANKEKYLQLIMDASGWSRGQAELEILKAKNICGCSYEDYYVFRFWELSEKEQSEYVTLSMFNRMRIQYNDHNDGVKYFDDKAEFNRTFHDFIHRRWFVNDETLTYQAFRRNLDGLSTLFVKPLDQTQGKGIEKYTCGGMLRNRSLYKKFMSLDPSIAEEYIHQHPKMAELSPSSVNTVRLTTLYKDGICHYLYSVLRMGSGSVVDNFHAGGIAASVDVHTGRVSTDAVNLEGEVFSVHPVSGIVIKEFEIPHWDQILEVARQAASRIETVRLVGWDFAITADGIELIEGNPGASYVVAQLPNVPIRKGLRHIMVDPYL